MIRRILLALFLPIIVSSTAYSADDKIDLDDLILGLPKGWIVNISRPNYFDPCGNKALFTMEFKYPDISYEYQSKAGKMKLSPTFTLYFYRPFSKERFKEFEEKANGILNSPKAVAPPLIFAKNKKYLIMSYNSGRYFRHEKEKEIYEHLKKVLSNKL